MAADRRRTTHFQRLLALSLSASRDRMWTATDASRPRLLKNTSSTERWNRVTASKNDSSGREARGSNASRSAVASSAPAKPRASRTKYTSFHSFGDWERSSAGSNPARLATHDHSAYERTTDWSHVPPPVSNSRLAPRSQSAAV